MAQLYPSFADIDKLKPPPTPGEEKLIHFLCDNLDESYEVFFQPLVNGDAPDIVLLRKNSGAVVIEVKDWNLECYEPIDFDTWQLKNITGPSGREQLIRSPLKQVKQYCDNIFHLHVEGLQEQLAQKPKRRAMISSLVYFHCSSHAQLCDFFSVKAKQNDSFLSQYDCIWGRDDLTPENLHRWLEKKRMTNLSLYFNDAVYDGLKRQLVPSIHRMEQGEEIQYSSEQLRLIGYKSGESLKIKGIAGSGKTLILAKRAVNAYERTKSPVLILTFNITLRNYIHDQISRIRNDFAWKNFIILHYHAFISSYKNNHNLPDSKVEKERYNLPAGEMREKYKAIFIDEIQDYEQEWVANVRRFLYDDGEYVVFGDEKQNIYHRGLDEERKPYTGIRGNWNRLKRSYRLSTPITKIATAFQQMFFSGVYDYDEIEQTKAGVERSEIMYYYLESVDIDFIIKLYNATLSRYLVNENDVCILGSMIKTLRLIEQAIKLQGRKTKTTFESQEIYEELLLKYTDSDGWFGAELFKMDIESIRRSKKFNFWMNSGTTKLSTIHSFKGWEIDTLILLIENEVDEDHCITTNELVYTALTRCRRNLIVINVGNEACDEFFSQRVRNFVSTV